MTEEQRRSELFGEVLVQLDSAAEEAAKVGSGGLAEHIRGVLIPFIEKERSLAQIKFLEQRAEEERDDV
jgi:hypothetical protein